MREDASYPFAGRTGGVFLVGSTGMIEGGWLLPGSEGLEFRARLCLDGNVRHEFLHLRMG